MPRDLTPEEIAAQYGNAYVADAPRAGDLTRLGTAWGDRVPAGLYGIGEAMGLPLQEQRLANQFENQQTMQRFYQTNPNEPQSYKDIGGVGDLGRYAKGLLIDSSPELVTGLVTGGVAGGVYGLGALGRTVAGAAVNAPSALGDILQNQREAGGRTDLASAALLTVPYAAADMVGLEGAVARGSMMRTGLKRLDDIQGFKGAAARTGANVAMNAPIEGASETFQEMVNQAARGGVNPQERMFSPEALDRYGESFVGGALLGGGVSGAMGGWRRSEGYQQPQQDSLGETNMMAPAQPSTSQTRQYGLVTQPAPLQDRINAQLGIGQKSVAGKKYASQFEAAFNEPSGQYVQDPETGIERPLTVGELMQRGTAALDLTVANPAATAAASTVVSNVTKSRDPQDILLRDTLNVIPNQHSRALLTAMAESGIDPESKVAEAVWNYAGQKYMTPARLTKALAILDESIIEARKGTTNVSSTTAPISTAPTSMAAGSPVVSGSVGLTGPSVASNVQPSTSPILAGTPAGQAQPTTTTVSQPATPVIQGTTNGPKAPQAKQTKTQGQTTTRGAAGTTPLVDTSDDALEIARATGNAAEIEAMREDEAGLRTEVTSLSEEDATRVIGARFAKSKNAKRDTEILNAYLTALRTNAGTDKAAIQNAIGDKYGITAVAVRKIGNPSMLVAAGAELGFSPEQVLDLFNVDDNTKAQFTEIGKLEAEIRDLRKAYNKAVDADKRNEVADRMAALSERITKIKEKADQEKSAAFSAGLQEAGVSSVEGESAGFGFDTEREWSRVEGESKVASNILELSNQIESLQEAAAKLDAQGQSEAADEARNAIAARQAKIDAVLATVQAETKPVASKAAPDVAEARKRWNDAGRDLTKLSTEDLQVLKGYTASINNKALSDKITAEISSRGAPQETSRAVQVQSPTSVSVQPKAEVSQGVGQEVRSTEKPASKGEVAVLTPQEQYEKVTAGFPVPAWTDLTQTQQGKLTDLARRDQLNLAAVNRFVAAQVTDESNIIDVEARVIDETVKPQVAKLAAPQIDRLEKHYGVGRDTEEFLAKVKEDIVLYATKGAEAVAAAIRDIIRSLQAGVLSVAIIFNPTGISQIESFIVIPQETQVTTQVVQAQVPAEVKGMSAAGKQAYATLIPALKAQKYSKFITIADKPAGQVYVFKADGSLVMQKKALFGLAKGDLYKGNNDLPSNRVTPAGLFGIHVVDAAKGGGAAKTAGEYDFGKVFALDDPDATVTFMHSVWLKESDASKRAAALKNESAADSRYSFGCINLDKDMFRQMVSNYANEMDGSKLFVVPDVQSTVADFLSGNVANDKLVREGVQPATKTIVTPVQSLSQAVGVDRTQVGKEEDGAVRFSKMTAEEAVNPRAPKARRSGEIVLELDAKLGSNLFGNPAWASFVRVHDNAEAAFTATGKKIPMEQLANAQGFVDPRDPRVVHMIASNIAKGSELSVLIHELGVHVGLKGQLGSNFKLLEAQVRSWKNAPKSSMEYKVWEAANARTAAATLEGAVTQEISGEELVAYAAEEAVLMGVKPSKNAQDKLSNFLQSIKEMVQRAFKSFFKVETLPDVSAQDLVDFAFAAAQTQAGEIRTEVGTEKRAPDSHIMRFYAGVNNGGKLNDSATIANLNGTAAGQEEFNWGTDSKFGSFNSITTDGFRYRTREGQDVFQMVVTSAESRKVAAENPAPPGGNDEYDDVLQTVMLVRNPGASYWDASVQGPDQFTPLYNELFVDGKATKIFDTYGNDNWTRLEGIPMRDTRRVLTEARRRLTRSLGGAIPEIRFVRVTGSGNNIANEGRPGGYTADEISIRYSKKPDQGMIAKNISKLPKGAQQPVRNSLAAIGDLAGKGLDYMVFTSDLVNRATKEGVTSAKRFVDLIGQSKAEARANEIAVEKIADMYALVPEKDRGTGDDSVNRFLFDSTREAKWGYGQYRDVVMGARFDKLSKESQAFVEAVFKHGSTMLAQKKKLVLDSTNSEYDAMIAVARASGDTKAESKLLNEKKATIKRFQTLFKIRDGMPYAPIKRNGSHVVIAKSAKYLAAEAANDTKLIEKLEADSDHYHVSFTDGKWEGRTLQQELTDQGAFESVELAERDSVVDEMFSGHSALRELTKMRSRVDEQAKAGDKSASKMLSLISQMYLEALAEGSARKSEMRRRGVAGEVDMIRSFAQQGRADANFMASVKYNPQVQKALQEMRTQAKGGNRERRSELLNELAKRYIQSLEYSPRPWLNKLTRMSSIYYLATSPAYYLQNLTQPWMMSVPAMAGQHDYTAASGALFKAYTELGGVMKSAKLLKQQFDFDKVPADVRDAIKELVNRGKIDIGLDTEIGEFKVEGDGYFAGKISAADKALRLAVQKVESVNRLSTAMAAYRLELARTKGDKQAATDYADRILTETHGDYTSFNAPRAFNTGVGKIALQFRKFQLIQLAFYAKLIKDALQGNDRAAALKTLAYSLSHTAVLAGAMGLPGYSAIAWAIGALLGDDDEPYDLTAEIRKAIGDEEVANLVLRGAPTLAGMDISGKVGAGNMLSIMPFSQADLSTTAGRAEALGTLIGGATLGMVSRMVDGLGLMLSGDWYRGIEQTMPKGVSDAMKAYRIANEGLTRRNGDVVLPASEVSTMDSLFQAIGISPVQQTVTYERQNAVKALTQNFQDRTTELKNQYTKAERQGDLDAKAKARDEWKNLQDARVRNGLERKPLSDLLKAPAEQRKREKETVGGIPYTKATKKLAQQYAEI